MTRNPDIASSELADTGLWRLVILLSSTSAAAWLVSRTDNRMAPYTIFEKSFENADASTLLKFIENAVYDNPRVLDDFNTEIIVQTPHTIWIPEDADISTDPDYDAFAQVYPQLAESLLIDDAAGMRCLYALCNGMPEFLQRTFPGARIMPHQRIILSHAMRHPSENAHIYVNIDSIGVDYLGFDGRKLLFARTTGSDSDNNIIYTLFNATQAYGINPAEMHVFISGDKQRRLEIAPRLRKYVAFVMPVTLPRTRPCDTLPLAARLCMSQ